MEDDRHRKAGCAEILVALGADGLTVNGLSVSQLPAEKIPALLGTLASVQTALAARLLVAQGGPKASGHDQLLNSGDAADRLGVSRDWLYRHAGKLPFVVRQGRLLRFSARGIDDYIEQLQKRFR